MDGYQAAKALIPAQPVRKKHRRWKTDHTKTKGTNGSGILQHQTMGKKRPAEGDPVGAPSKDKFKVSRTSHTEKDYNVAEITVPEIQHTLTKFKRRKTPGPDEVPMELFIEMDEKCLAELAALLNTWWREEDIPAEILQARVVVIFKKGDTGKYENYRPISLLNAVYKIYAGIL